MEYYIKNPLLYIVALEAPSADMWGNIGELWRVDVQCTYYLQTYAKYSFSGIYHGIQQRLYIREYIRKKILLPENYGVRTLVELGNLSNIFFSQQEISFLTKWEKNSLLKLHNSLSLSFHIGAESPFSVETLIPWDLSWLHIVFKVELSSRTIRKKNYSRTKCEIESRQNLQNFVNFIKSKLN